MNNSNNYWNQFKKFLQKELYRKVVFKKERILRVWHVWILFIFLGTFYKSPCAHIEGVWKGENISGQIRGSAKVVINSDCTCSYELDLGNYGSSMERGKIIISDNGNSLETDDGYGKYDVNLSMINSTSPSITIYHNRPNRSTVYKQD